MSTLLEALRRIETRTPPVSQPPAIPTGLTSSARDVAPPSPPCDAPTPSPDDAALAPLPDTARLPAEDETPSAALDARTSRLEVGPAGEPPGALTMGDQRAPLDQPAANDELARLAARTPFDPKTAPDRHAIDDPADVSPSAPPPAGASSATVAVPNRADRRVARQMLEQLDRRRVDPIGDRAGAVVLWVPVETLPGLDGAARRVAAALGEALGAEVIVWSSADGSSGANDKGYASGQGRSAPGARPDRPSASALREAHRAALVVAEPANRCPFDPSLGEYDGVYLIVELGTTTRRAAAEAAARARAAGGRLLGCIAVPPSRCETSQGTAR